MSNIIHISQGSESRPKVTQKVTQTINSWATPISDKEIKELRVQAGWLSVEQFAQISRQKKNTIQYRCLNGKYAKQCRQIDKDGRRPYQIYFSELPADGIREYRRIVTNEQPKTAEEIEARNIAFRERSKVTDYNANRALKRNSVLKMYRQFIASGAKGKLLDRKAAFCERYNRGGFLELEVEREVIKSVSWKTLDVWQQELDKAEGDPYGLATKYGARRDIMMVSVRESEALMEFALHPNKLTYAEIVTYAKRKLEAEGYPVRCSEATLARWVKKHSIENAYLHDLMRDGEKALNDRHIPALQRDRDKIEVGDKLVSDGHTFNFTMRDPISGKPKRMTLVLVFDFRSGMPVGWDFAASENTAVIASAYRRAIKTIGFVPRELYVDNGRAFNSRYFGKKERKAVNIFGEREFLGLFERLKPYGFIECVNALPYHGQSKPIERYFGTMHEFEKRMPTYLGNSIPNRVASDHRNEKIHRDLRERMTGGAIPEVTEVNMMLLEWIREYATTPATKSAFYPGRTPLEVYEESLTRVRLANGFEHRLISDQDLMFLMMAGEIRTVHNSKIRLFGREFYAPELFGYRSGEKRFVVRYDLLDTYGTDRVFVFDEYGETFICEAKDDLMSGHHPSARNLGTADDQQRLEAALDEQGALKSAAKKMAKTVIGQGFYDAVASQEAQVVPSMRQIEQGRKAVAEVATGTDGEYITTESERDALRRRLLEMSNEEYEEVNGSEF
jgi:putative transposase